MDYYTLYVHVNKANGKRYVGITSQPLSYRWRQGKGYEKQKRFYSAIKHYGWNGFEHIVLAKGLTKEEAERREEATIREYRSNDLRYGYNIENGGVVHKISDAQKAHLRQINIGKSHTPETLKKMREVHLGQSTKWLTGRKLSEETKRRMSRSRKGARSVHSVPVNQFDLGGNFIARFECMEDARIAVGAPRSANISRCCLGERNTAYGYIWRYAERR